MHAILLIALAAGQLQPVTCEGTYPRHLQGVAIDGRAIYWSWTDALVKTDMQGRLMKRAKAASHHGDLCVVKDKVFVAVNLGPFNQPAGKADALTPEQVDAIRAALPALEQAAQVAPPAPPA